MTDKITLERIKEISPELLSELYQIYTEASTALTGKAILRFAYVFRSFAEQNLIYSQGRTRPGKIVTNAKPGQSIHNFRYACYSDDTEILTDSGWKLFSELDKTEKVMVFKDGILYYEHPKSYISNDYNGEMVSVQTRSVDLLVTPNHKMVVQKKVNNKWNDTWKFTEASEITYKHRIPTAGEFIHTTEVPEYPFMDKMDAETWWEFMGWYLSEGSCCGVSNGVLRTHNSRYRVSISQNENSSEWHLIKDCLDRTGFTYNYIGHDFIIHSKELHTILFSLGNSYEKRIPRYCLNAPKYLLEILLESLLLGDGTHYEKRETYHTVNELLANDISELFVLLGKSVSISSNLSNPLNIFPNGNVLKSLPKLQYKINNRSRKTQELRNGSDSYRCINKEEYTGIVYCVETSAGSIVVKRNGKISICGNCDIVLLKDTDGNGTFETASWETNVDFDGDGKADWMEVVAIFQKYGWQWGLTNAKGQRYDLPHFQKPPMSLKQLQLKYPNGR